MNKFLPYFLGFLLLAGLVFIVSGSKKPKRVVDERVTLRETDKIPYGFYVARILLPSLFPGAKISSESTEPEKWSGVNSYSGGQLVVLTGTTINADRVELDAMLKFVRRGNYIFIIGQYYGYELERATGVSNNVSLFQDSSPDSFTVSLNQPRFEPSVYGYPGKKFSGHFNEINSNHAVPLGRDGKLNPNFIQLRAGDGSIFINLCPAAFTNYFLLYGDNIEYYEKAFSLVPRNVNKVVWNEYYLTEKSPKEKEPNWLGVLLRYPAFRAGLLLALLIIIFYMLMEMRRRQRYVPVYQKPKNETLDFVQTIGRLYYDKKDHLDLAGKMSVYFLDHVREKYRLQTEELNDDFILSLNGKTGFDTRQIRKIVEFIDFLRTAPAISEGQLARFHDQLETFYKNT